VPVISYHPALASACVECGVGDLRVLEVPNCQVAFVLGLFHAVPDPAACPLCVPGHVLHAHVVALPCLIDPACAQRVHELGVRDVRWQVAESEVVVQRQVAIPVDQRAFKRRDEQRLM
jgi:hypothetical protein